MIGEPTGGGGGIAEIDVGGAGSEAIGPGATGTTGTGFAGPTKGVVATMPGGSE